METKKTPNAIRTQKCCSQQLLCSGFFRACLCRACLDLSQFSCLPEHSSKPLLWAYSLHSSGQSELCCYAHPAGRAFLSSSTHSQQSCPQTSLCYFCLDWFFVVVFFKHLIHTSLLIFLLFLLHSVSSQGSTRLPARTHTRIQLRIINKETIVQDRKQSLERILFLAFQSWKNLLFLIFGDTN